MRISLVLTLALFSFSFPGFSEELKIGEGKCYATATQVADTGDQDLRSGETDREVNTGASAKGQSIPVE